MKTNINENGDKIVVTLIGDLDTAAAQDTEKIFKPLMEEKNKEITLECRDLNYISSSGLRLFLSLLKSCKANGSELVLKNINENILKVFSMTGFSSLFNIQ